MYIKFVEMLCRSIQIKFRLSANSWKFLRIFCKDGGMSDITMRDKYSIGKPSPRVIILQGLVSD